MTQPANPGLYVTTPSGGSSPAVIARRPLPYTTIYVDPGDETGNASDANPGTDPAHPIATTAHLNAINFFGVLTADTVAQYLSDDASGTFVDLSTLALGTFNYTVRQTRQVLHNGGTLNAGTTAINPSTNQAQVVHTSDIADFAPLLFTGAGGGNANWTRITDTVTTAGAWLYFGAGSASAETSRAVLPDGTAGALTIGHAYQVTRGGLLALASTAAPVSSGGVLIFEDCAFPAGSAGPFTPGSFNGSVPTFNRCSFLGTLAVSGNFSDCAGADGMQGVLIVSLSAGVLIPNGNTDEMPGTLNISGDTVITGTASAALIIAGTFITQLFVSAGIGAGIQFQRGVGLTIGDGGSITQGFAIGASALIWGQNNSGLGVGVSEGGNGIVPRNPLPTVQGALGQFGFIVEGAPVTVARAVILGAYSEAGGVATRTTTWAHLAASTGAGGFGFAAHNPETSASLIAV